MTTATTRDAARDAARAALQEDIDRVERALDRQRLVLAILTLVGLGTRRTRDRLGALADRLACLRYRRQDALRASGTEPRVPTGQEVALAA